MSVILLVVINNKIIHRIGNRMRVKFYSWMYQIAAMFIVKSNYRKSTIDQHHPDKKIEHQHQKSCVSDEFLTQKTGIITSRFCSQ